MPSDKTLAGRFRLLFWPPEQVRVIKRARPIMLPPSRDEPEAGPWPDASIGYQVIEEEWRPGTWEDVANQWRILGRDLADPATWERNRRELAEDLGRIWYKRAPLSRAWWLMARRVGFWYAARYVRVSRVKAVSGRDMIVAGITPAGLAPVKADRDRPWWCPLWAWRVAYPYGRLSRGDSQ